MNCVNSDNTLIFSNLLKISMKSKGWSVIECKDCGRSFYSKDLTVNQCGWRKCPSSKLKSSLIFNKKQISLSSLLKKFKTLFSGLGYSISPSISMVSGFNTDLVSAGVQIFSEILLTGVTDGKEGLKYFVAQPCVRLGSLKSQEDNLPHDMSTSFVNICTEGVGLTAEGHISSIDDWLSALSGVGLHANHVNLVIRDRVENWGAGDFLVHQVFFVYSGIEIGDANFIYSVPSNTKLSMSDIGFGLERICWVINGTKSYSDVFMNLGLDASSEFQDVCRTIALLVSNGIPPSGRGAGGRLRWLIRRAMLLGDTANVLRLVYFYLDFWKEFNEFKLDYDSISRVLLPECDYKIIRELCLEFGVSQKPGLNLIELIEILVYNRGKDSSLISEFISNKRNEK